MIEKDGTFYEIDNSSPLKAKLVTDEFPDYLGVGSDKVWKDGANWKFKVSWQEEPLTATVGKGYWVMYGPCDFNFLEMGTPSANAYNVVDANGNIKCNLSKYNSK